MGNLFQILHKATNQRCCMKTYGQHSFIKKSLHWLAVSKRGFALNFYRENPLIQIQ